MSSIRPFQMDDLFSVNPINIDPLTENFNPSFYSQYLIEWPTFFFKSTEETHGLFDQLYEISGYMMGKTEGRLDKKEWHTHITAVTVMPTYRRLGLAQGLCVQLEKMSVGGVYDTLFVDLFVKVTNSLAYKMYKGLGYSVYRRVIGYYGRTVPEDRNNLDDEIDAFDMRKALPRDIKRETVRDNGEKVYVLPNEIEF
ncbi:N-terminal acetyltransferase [Scheffersomyces spartinae]|uniref:N-terminal acetyltransferase n=1 Tax=Scheffersomyces spartinae TaxID=45513 RepID=A0A9P7V9A2_9ASCO|nr:N-terminal acetyltransferase [Scheffersomyces spartinae]KAG7193732.1 N-terminal acetyltransferase [Scheffersomyces spartinae]